MSVNDTPFQMITLPPTQTPEGTEVEVEMEPIFQVDNDIYRIPKRPSAGLALGYLEIQSQEGPDAAVFWMMIQMLGQEGYDALKNHPDLPREHMDAIIKHVEGRLLGGMQENPTGESRHRVSAQ